MRVLVLSYVGSVIELLDFYLYTIAAASVFTVLFFPSKDPVISMLASLGSLAVAYVVRPLGGLIYGYFGDRVGRKQMLVSSMLLMGLSTVLVGCLPIYGQVGVWAPVMLVLLRSRALTGHDTPDLRTMEVTAVLNAALRNTLADPVTQKKLADVGSIGRACSPEEMHALVVTDFAK